MDHVDIDDNRVILGDGYVLEYDVLVVASGSRLLPEETKGSPVPAGRTRCSPSTTSPALEAALRDFDGRRPVVNVGMPIKRPVAPLEFRRLADWYFRERGIRDNV